MATCVTQSNPNRAHMTWVSAKGFTRRVGPTARTVSMIFCVMLVSLFLIFTVTSRPVLAKQVCGERTQILEKLAKRYSETPQSIGLSADGNVVQVLVSEAGTWSILVSHPSRRTCLVAVGNHWESMPPLPVGPST